jgi:hypothetical protein
MLVGVEKTEIGFEGIGVEMRSRLDCGADFRSECSATHVGDVDGFDAARPLVDAALDNAENRCFAGTTSAFDLPLADVPVHVLGEPANKRFVGFHLAAHLQERTSLHCETDAVIHEPCGFLCDAERPMHLVAADSVLAGGDHPDCSEPLSEVDWAILKDRSDLGGELAARMLLFALPQTAGRNESNVSTTACWATDAAGPAQLDHCAQRDIRSGEVPDRFDQSLRLGGRRIGFHTDQYDTDRLLSQVCYSPH